MDKILLIVNPHSGKKRGVKISHDVIQIFKNKNLNYNLIETTHQKHPFEIMNNIDIEWV